jgi:hypothetical protein
MSNPLARFVTSHGKRIEVVTQPSKVPARVRKRQEAFAILPMRWYEKLAKPPPSCRITCLVAWQLLYLDFKSHGRPFKLPNGVLRYDGIDRHAKYRALSDLEKRKLITIERRGRKSAIIHVHT